MRAIPTLDAHGRDKLRNRLPAVALTALKAIQAAKACPKGFELFLEGQPPSGVYILYAGRVDLYVTDIHGRQMVLGTALPGDVLGLSAVVSGRYHEETAVAAVPSKAGFVTGKEFLRFLDHHPEAAFWVVQLLSQQVSTTLDHLSGIQHPSPREIRQ